MKITMSFRGRVKIPTKPAQKKDAPAPVADSVSSSTASGELRALQQNLYLSLLSLFLLLFRACFFVRIR
jgi:hypothetical protein